MGFTIGLPSLKLNNVGNKSKHCGSFKKVAEEALKERLGLDLDINPELAAENVYIGIETAEELMQYSAEHIAEMDYNRPEGARKIRSDAVVMCSTIIKPPMEMMEGLDRQQQEQFLRDAYDSFLEIIGAENAKAAVMHFDELSPHIHIFWEPMTEDGRLCAKEMHNLKFFGKLNREMPQMLRDKGWDVDDCQAYDKAEEDKKREEMGEAKYREYRKEQKAKRKTQGKDSHAFKHEAEQAVQQLTEQQAALQRDVQRLEERKSELQEQTAAEQQKLEQAKRDAVTAVEIPPRPTEIALIAKPEMPKDPRTVSYWTKEEYHDYQRVQLPAWKKECKAIDRQNAEIEKQNALIRQQQAEWDAIYKPMQLVREVQEQQEQTAARQALIAQQQSQTAKKQQEQAAALAAAQKSIPQKIAEGVRQQLSRSERLAQLMQATASWKQRYEQMFNKPYTDTPQERTDLDADKSHKAKQNIHHWTR